MNRAFWIVGPLLAVALLLSIAAAFYWAGDGWGHQSDTVQVIGTGNVGTDASGHPVDVVRVVEPGFHRHWGFFPFAFLGPLLGIFVVFVIVRAILGPRHWRHHYYGHHHDRDDDHDGGPRHSRAESFEEWHRHQHEANGANGEKQGNPSDS